MNEIPLILNNPYYGWVALIQRENHALNKQQAGNQE